MTTDLTARYRQSPLVHANKRLAVHHTATTTPSPLLSPQQEIALIDQIDRYHRDVRKFDVGIGYHVLVFPSGRSYRVGNQGTQRAHVASRNHEFDGLCFVGNYVSECPSGAAIEEARRVIADAAMAVAGGHGALTGGSTACPGTWPVSLLTVPPPPVMSPQMTVADLTRIFMYLTPGLPAGGVRITPQERRNNRRAYLVELP